MKTGTVKTINSRGFCFLTDEDGGKDVFAHASAFENAVFKTLHEGQRVRYEIGEERGRTCAVSVIVQ